MIVRGKLGKEVEFADGSKMIRDEAYIKQSIIEPQAKVVKGRPASMASFKKQFKDRDKELVAIVAYIRSLTPVLKISNNK